MGEAVDANQFVGAAGGAQLGEQPAPSDGLELAVIANQNQTVLAHGATSETVGRAIAATGLVAYEISQQSTDLEQAFLHLTVTTTTGAPR